MAETRTAGEAAKNFAAAGQKSSSKSSKSLFPELRVTLGTDEKKLAGLVSAIFSGKSAEHPGDIRAVDIMLRDREAGGKLIYSLAYLPKELGITVQVLPRRRERRARVVEDVSFVQAAQPTRTGPLKISCT